MFGSIKDIFKKKTNDNKEYKVGNDVNLNKFKKQDTPLSRGKSMDAIYRYIDNYIKNSVVSDTSSGWYIFPMKNYSEDVIDKLVSKIKEDKEYLCTRSDRKINGEIINVLRLKKITISKNKDSEEETKGDGRTTQEKERRRKEKENKQTKEEERRRKKEEWEERQRQRFDDNIIDRRV